MEEAYRLMCQWLVAQTSGQPPRPEIIDKCLLFIHDPLESVEHRAMIVRLVEFDNGGGVTLDPHDHGAVVDWFIAQGD